MNAISHWVNNALRDVGNQQYRKVSFEDFAHWKEFLLDFDIIKGYTVGASWCKFHNIVDYYLLFNNNVDDVLLYVKKNYVLRRKNKTDIDSDS